MASVVRYDSAALNDLLRSPRGPVAGDLLRRGRAVESRAKVLAPVDRGRLRSSITHELVTVRGDLVVRVGSNVAYARFVHEGTGIYGPKGQPIRPVRARVLSWPSRPTTSRRRTRTGRIVTTRAQAGKRGRPEDRAFAMQVRGSPPRRYLANALPAART